MNNKLKQEEMTTKQKREELAKLIEYKVQRGEYIADYMCRPLDYFDWEVITEINKNLNKQLNNVNNE